MMMVNKETRMNEKKLTVLVKRWTEIPPDVFNENAETAAVEARRAKIKNNMMNNEAGEPLVQVWHKTGCSTRSAVGLSFFFFS